jgi:hypothetical protein
MSPCPRRSATGLPGCARPLTDVHGRPRSREAPRPPERAAQAPELSAGAFGDATQRTARSRTKPQRVNAASTRATLRHSRR